MQVSCVLRSGGDFKPAHVARLHEQVMSHVPVSTEFLCLTDMLDEVTALGVPACGLDAKWPGWWAKMCAFRLPGPNLQLDLDVTIIGDLAPLLDECAKHELVILGDWLGRQGWVISSVMGWRGDISRLTTKFAGLSDQYRKKYSAGQIHSDLRRFGDQAFIRDHWDGELILFQDVLPGHILSYKKHWRLGQVDRSECRIVCYHSWPRPWAIPDAGLSGEEYRRNRVQWRSDYINQISKF